MYVVTRSTMIRALNHHRSHAGTSYTKAVVVQCCASMRSNRCCWT